MNALNTHASNFLSAIPPGRMQVLFAVAGAVLVSCSPDPFKGATSAANLEGAVSEANECALENRQSLSPREYALERPKDFYALCYSRDADVCTEATTLLNAFPSPDPSNKVEAQTFRVVGAKLWDGYSTISFRDDFVNADKLDIFNNGEKYAVFQTRMGIGGVKAPTLIVSKPLVSDESVPLDVGLFLSSRDQGDKSLNGEVSPSNLIPIFPSEYSWAGASVGQINNRNYVVFFAPADSFPVGRVAIVEMHDRNSGEYICKFTARYEVEQSN